MGARRILCLPALPALPARMLVQARDSQHQHGSLLALVASVVRHLPIEANAVTLQRRDASRVETAPPPQDVPGTGTELRTERFDGDLAAWLAQVSALPHPPLLVLELPSVTSELDAALRGDLAMLFNPQSRVPLLFAIEP
jgi:hypothetical protein